MTCAQDTELELRVESATRLCLSEPSSEAMQGVAEAACSSPNGRDTVQRVLADSLDHFTAEWQNALNGLLLLQYLLEEEPGLLDPSFVEEAASLVRQLKASWWWAEEQDGSAVDKGAEVRETAGQVLGELERLLLQHQRRDSLAHEAASMLANAVEAAQLNTPLHDEDSPGGANPFLQAVNSPFRELDNGYPPCRLAPLSIGSNSFHNRTPSIPKTLPRLCLPPRGPPSRSTSIVGSFKRGSNRCSMDMGEFMRALHSQTSENFARQMEQVESDVFDHAFEAQLAGNYHHSVERQLSQVERQLSTFG